MIPMFWMMGGGALSFGGMSVAIEKEEHSPEECGEIEECEECPDIPARKQELQSQIDALRSELDRTSAANDALLSQLTLITATCSP